VPFYYGWIVVGASGTAVFARMAPAITTLTVFIYPMSEELGWSRTLISGTVSAGAIGALALSPAIGWCIDRFGSRPVLVISTLVLGLAMTSLAWATIPITFYLAYAAGRVVFHTSAPIAASTVISRWFVRKRGRAIGALFVCNAAGGILFTMLAAILISKHGVNVAWAAIGVVVLAVSVVPNLLLVVERPEEMGLAPDGDSDKATAPLSGAGLDPAPEESWTAGEAVRSTAFWAVLLVGLVHFFIHTGVSVHIAAYLRDQGLSAANAAAAVSFSWAVSGVSALLWGWALERVQPRLLYSIIMVCLAGASLVLMFVPGALGAYCAAFLIGTLSAGGLVVPAVVYGNFFGRAHLGTIRGIGETGVLIGQAAGPLFAGLMFDLRGSYTLVFTVYAALACAGILLVLGARRPVRVGAPSPVRLP
jgi:MFS family permease